MSKIDNTLAKVAALDDNQQLEVMRYWVSEANMAQRNIALIRGFEQSRRRFVESKSLPEEMASPAYSPVGRVSTAILDVVLDSIIMFSFKAFDQDKQAASLSKLKDVLFQNAANDGLVDNVAAAFRSFNRNNESVLKDLRMFRKKKVAHIDYDFLLGQKQVSLTVEEALTTATKIVDLVALLAKFFIKVGTTESPTVADNSLIIAHAEFLELDAEEFWRVTFGQWAK